MTKQRLDDTENGRDRPVFEITPAMIEAATKVFCDNGWGMPINEFTVSEIRDLLPEALLAALKVAPCSV
jgi:hypothetical protein